VDRGGRSMRGCCSGDVSAINLNIYRDITIEVAWLNVHASFGLAFPLRRSFSCPDSTPVASFPSDGRSLQARPPSLLPCSHSPPLPPRLLPPFTTTLSSDAKVTLRHARQSLPRSCSLASMFAPATASRRDRRDSGECIQSDSPARSPSTPPSTYAATNGQNSTKYW
jgi:hypothetical protein